MATDIRAERRRLKPKSCAGWRLQSPARGLKKSQPPSSADAHETTPRPALPQALTRAPHCPDRRVRPRGREAARHLQRPHGPPARPESPRVGLGRRGREGHRRVRRSKGRDHGKGRQVVRRVDTPERHQHGREVHRQRQEQGRVQRRGRRRGVVLLRPVEHGVGRKPVEERAAGNRRREQPAHPPLQSAARHCHRAADRSEDLRRLATHLAADRRQLLCRGLFLRARHPEGTRRAHRSDRLQLGRHAH